MNMRQVIVISRDGDRFTVEIFGRSDAQIAKAWEAEQKYAAGKSTAQLIEHGNFTLVSADTMYAEIEHRVMAEMAVNGWESVALPGAPPPGRPILRLIQGGRA